MPDSTPSKPPRAYRRKPRPREQASLKAIAEKIGVSAMTVSRALNGRPGVSDETRRRILEEASLVRYRPNMLVHGIRTGHSRNIGVIIPPVGDFVPQVLHGVHQTLAEAGYLPLLHYPANHSAVLDAEAAVQAETKVLHALLDRRVDGVILWPAEDAVPDVYFGEIWERGIPLLAVDRCLSLTQADFVGSDDTGGALLAARHLLDLGHRRFAIVTGTARFATWAERERVFTRAVTTAGGSCATFVADGLDAAQAARKALESRPTAVFLTADTFAPDFYAAAASSSLRIGQDVSVVGFADLEMGRRLTPALTTVRQHAEEIGRRAAALMLDRCNGRLPAGSPPQQVRLPVDFVTRESTGPVPA